MYKLFVIAKNNMKKQKGDMITFFFLTFIAAYLIFIAVSALLGIGKVLDSRYKDINGAEFMLISGDSDEEKECIEKAISDHEYISDCESAPCLRVVAEHKGDDGEDFSQYYFIIESFNTETEYMQVVEDAEAYKENDILVPLYLRNTYSVGEKMHIKIGDNEYTFNVGGYAENPYFCSPINLTYYYVYISDTMMEKLKDENPGTVLSSIRSMGRLDKSKVREGYSTSDLEQEITDSYKNLLKPYSDASPEKDYNGYLSVNWEMVRGGSQFLPLIIMSIILFFAIIIIVITIVIISFSIKNFIQRNMKNTGILEASGYTVKELRRTLSIQTVFVSLIGSIFGTILAVSTFGIFGNILSLAVGLSWTQPINPMIAVMTILIIVGVIFLVSRIISRAYKKITVLDALRGGINTHNFKKNNFTFEKTPLPIPAVISLKETFGNAGRNIIMTLIVIILTVSVLMGFGMYENFGEEPQKVLDMMGFENGTLSVTTDADIADELRRLDGVKNVLPVYGLDLTVRNGDQKKSIYTFVMDVDSALNVVVLEGRIPKHDNEIMMTSGSAEDLSLSVGSVVEIEYAGNKKDYIITGLYQRMDRMGRSIYMTEDGGKRLIPGKPVIQYFVTGAENISYDTLKAEISEIEDKYDNTFEYVDLKKEMDATMGMVSMALKMLCIVIVIVTILVVVFVESLIIRAKIVREWKGMGISKAVGMTSWQLIAQIMMSNVPAIVLGTIIGIILSPFLGSKLTILIFSLFNIKKVSFNISIIWMIVSAVGILMVALAASCISGLKVRQLRPVDMITED